MSHVNRPVAMITGASRGIGLAIAKRFAREGYALSIGARSVPLIHDVARELAAYGSGVRSWHLDVASEQSVESFFHETLAAYGKVNLVVNNAGVERAELIENASLHGSKEVMDANFFGTLLCYKHAIISMRRTGGQIITICSQASFRGMPTKGVYCATKFAVRGLTDAARIEARRYGIEVSLVHPGYIETDLHRHLDLAMEKGYAPPKARYTAEDIAGFVHEVSRKPRPHLIPGIRGKLQVALNALFPRWTDRRTYGLFRRNGFEYY